MKRCRNEELEMGIMWGVMGRKGQRKRGQWEEWIMGKVGNGKGITDGNRE